MTAQGQDYISTVLFFHNVQMPSKSSRSICMHPKQPGCFTMATIELKMCIMELQMLSELGALLGTPHGTSGANFEIDDAVA